MDEVEEADVELIEPRFVRIRFNGTLTSEGAVRALDKISEAVSEEPYFLLEAVMNNIKGATPDARRLAAERLRELPDRAIAVMGGTFTQRMIAKLVLTATSLLSSDKKNVVSFFKDSESAHAWLKEFAAKRDRA